MPVIQDIRQMHRDGMSIAEISRKTNVSEPTVRKYVRMEDLSPKVPAKRRVPSMLDDYAPLIGKWLEEDRGNWHKQRHTAQRVFERLVAEHGFEGSYSTVRRHVKRYREEHKGSASQYLDQDWPPGEMQVDFGQADFRIVGVRTRMHDLVCAFPFSNVGLAQVFYGEAAECVCEGPIAVFEHIRGVPRKIVFDNATGVGRKICGVISTSKPFSAFAARYGLSYALCNPNAGRERGSVENVSANLKLTTFANASRRMR